MIYLELRAKGADVDNHSGNKGGVLPNPAWKLIDLLRTMRDEHGNVLVEGFYDHVRAPTEQDIRYIQRLPYDKEQFGRQAGFRDLDLDAEAYYRRLMLEPTFNICGFHSGYGGEGSKTIIPAEAVVKMDIRLVLDQTPQYVFDRFCAHVRRLAPDVEVRLLGSVKPSRTRPELPIVRTIVEAVGQCYREEPVVELSLGGTLPDYVWTELLGIPSVQVPYANYDEANHAPNENITLKHFYAGIRCTGHIIHALADYAKKGAADRAIPDWR
jgi:acetylornithine deacetylase/succinyl-diaminopimelate desuccinylase-like protein